ncbi:protein of unknown function [Vibrio tapetis subsp. tapetis]|uniref:Uncharacterized protein n=1 Tax=Vibrio tapetis subsp. tapetis TaxID=1671868 RepID=A0A2N8ZK70_9VIBR|nr:protein of unknown function [Vibrio tapetis subsp. tapetis]
MPTIPAIISITHFGYHEQKLNHQPRCPVSACRGLRKWQSTGSLRRAVRFFWRYHQLASDSYVV